MNKNISKKTALKTEIGTICRFAPSPTGFLHVGNIRAAIVNYLFAIKNNGNVGIGTTSPGSKLEVIGRTKITQSADALRINSSDANGSYATWQNNGSNIGYMGAGYHLWSSPNNIATRFRSENSIKEKNIISIAPIPTFETCELKQIFFLSFYP